MREHGFKDCRLAVGRVHVKNRKTWRITLIRQPLTFVEVRSGVGKRSSRLDSVCDSFPSYVNGAVATYN